MSARSTDNLYIVAQRFNIKNISKQNTHIIIFLFYDQTFGGSRTTCIDAA